MADGVTSKPVVATSVPVSATTAVVATVPKKKRTATLIEDVYSVQNKFGLWFKGVPRDDLTEEQMAELGPSFEIR